MIIVSTPRARRAFPSQRTCLPLFLLGALAAFPAVGQDGGFDGGTPLDGGVDAGVDAGVPFDAGAPEIDAGVPEIDAGAPEVDAGAPEIDAGAPEVDAGAPEIDAGAPPVDAGALPVDAGAPEVDAGAPPPFDGGAPPDDAGPPLEDAGEPEPVEPDPVEPDPIPEVDAGDPIREDGGVVAPLDCVPGCVDDQTELLCSASGQQVWFACADDEACTVDSCEPTGPGATGGCTCAGVTSRDAAVWFAFGLLAFGVRRSRRRRRS